jgi:hypothetical protein
MNVNDYVVGQDIIPYSTLSCSGEALMALSCGVFRQTKDASFFRALTRDFAVVTQGHKFLWVKHIGRGFTGPLLYPTPTPWSITVKGANFLLARNTCHPINSRPYQSPGIFQHGGSIW